MADRPAVPRSLLFAVALPVFALGLMVARAEITTRTGRPYRLSIQGYDPRDLVRGHYLRYRLGFLSSPDLEHCTAATCCYCLRGPAESEPAVTKVSCNETASCDAWFPEGQIDHLEQFFIPEDRGGALGSALRAHSAQLRVRVSAGGSVVIQDLLLDGKPWREVVP